jgi:predicted CoA-binding protein
MMQELQERIQTFLACREFAVVGASKNRVKFGNQVLRHYINHGKTARPIHPSEKEIEGLTCYPSLAGAPRSIDAVSIITPPAVTEIVVREALRLGIQNIWMQPGAESELAIQLAIESGANCIAGGACVLIELR